MGNGEQIVIAVSLAGKRAIEAPPEGSLTNGRKEWRWVVSLDFWSLTMTRLLK